MVPAMPRIIHLAGFPGSGRTSWCLSQARQVLESEQRVVWISTQATDPQRFAQVMLGLHPQHAARFHSYPAGEEFSNALLMVSNLIPQLPSTRLVVIEDWSDDKGAPQRILRENLKTLLSIISQGEIDLILTTLAYEDASGIGDADAMRVRSRSWFEKQGFETWRLEHIESKPGRRLLVKPDERAEWKLNDAGIGAV